MDLPDGQNWVVVQFDLLSRRSVTKAVQFNGGLRSREESVDVATALFPEGKYRE